MIGRYSRRDILLIDIFDKINLIISFQFWLIVRFDHVWLISLIGLCSGIVIVELVLD